ncbi:MAG: hypothetical protein J7K47_04085, partial [Thermoplasmata archaeon]|nr:hypothetical protein [Thermoplasmata archaeon]
MKISSNKILLLIFSFFAAVNNVAKFLPWIAKEFILLVLIMSFTWEYRKMLRGIHIKFTGGSSFTFLLFIYSVLAIFYSNIKLDSIWTIFLIVAFPVVFTLIYGFKYFKKNFSEIEIFYKKFFNEKDYKKFWCDYNLSRGLVRKLNKVAIYSIPGLFAGASIIILFLVLLILIYTDYLFLVVTFILIISDYITRKRLFIADSVQRSFDFLRYFRDIKGIFGSIL